MIFFNVWYIMIIGNYRFKVLNYITIRNSKTLNSSKFTVGNLTCPKLICVNHCDFAADYQLLFNKFDRWFPFNIILVSKLSTSNTSMTVCISKNGYRLSCNLLEHNSNCTMYSCGYVWRLIYRLPFSAITFHN